MKSLAKITIFLLLGLGLAGCTPQQDKSNKLLIWHWMTDRNLAFRELARAYEVKTGVQVDFELYAPSDQYSQRVRSAAQGANLPDIFGVLGEKRDFASFIKGGHILNLDFYMEEGETSWKSEFFPKTLAVNEFETGNTYGVKPGIYGVPLDITTIQMLYNKRLLKQLGISKPVTFSDLLEAGKKIRAANMQGLVSGWTEIWMIDCLASNYAFNIMGKDKVLATIRGEVSYTDPDWVRVLTLFKDMRESGVLAKGIVTMINKTAEQLFATEKAVFAFNGSWSVNVYKSMNPDLEYAAMLPPRASGRFPMVVWGGAGSSFMVNARSSKKEEAVKFLRWLTEADQQAYLAKATNNLAANKNCTSGMPEVLASFAKNMDVATHPNAWEVSEFSLVTEALDKGIQAIIIGEKTPNEVAAEVQKIKEKEMARNKPDR
ncbi:MAG: extracellular solute-binding protein [Candidatus Omnitrophota bacterium]